MRNLYLEESGNDEPDPDNDIIEGDDEDTEDEDNAGDDVVDEDTIGDKPNDNSDTLKT